MSFNEESARKIIDYLLEDDIDDFSRWLPFIEEFNSKQIENLLKGERNYEYPVKNKDIFINLVLKFDNFAEITLKWYQKEENYKYLKKLWLKYIVIEDIRILLKEDKNEQKLINYLESKEINYSQWPKEVKVEFKKCAERTIGSAIHEEDFKKALNEEHSLFNNAFKSITELKGYFLKLFENTDKKSQKKFEESSDSIISNLVGGLIGTVVYQLISTAKERIDYKCFEQFLVKQIKKYGINKCDAKKIASDIIKKSNVCPANGILNWTARDSANSGTDHGDNVSINNFCFDEKCMTLNLEGKENETISLGKKISTVFKSNIVCGLVAFASFTNLVFSAYKFHQISKLTETVAGKEYKNKLDQIKKKFEEHLNELDLTGNSNYYLAKINYVRTNIENDLKELEDLIVNIETDIKLFNKEKKESIGSLLVSILFGGCAAAGTMVATGGLSTVFYIASLLSNIVSGTKNARSINKCISSIKELEEIKKDAEEEKKIMEQKLDELKLKGKQKDLYFPDYYKQIDEIIQKQNKKAQNYILNKNFF
jgi:hypothetical protein